MFCREFDIVIVMLQWHKDGIIASVAQRHHFIELQKISTQLRWPLSATMQTQWLFIRDLATIHNYPHPALCLRVFGC